MGAAGERGRAARPDVRRAARDARREAPARGAPRGAVAPRVHLTPEARDAPFVEIRSNSVAGGGGEGSGTGIATKDPANERVACEDVGIIAPGYFVHSSRWCAREPFGAGDFVVRVAEVRDPYLVDAVDVHKIFANEHDPREWRPDRYDWGMRTLLRNERGCTFVDVKDSVRLAGRFARGDREGRSRRARRRVGGSRRARVETSAPGAGVLPGCEVHAPRG